jgi:hypothetical protein
MSKIQRGHLNYQTNMAKIQRGDIENVENTCAICGFKFRDSDPKPTCGSYRCLRAWGKRKTKESLGKNNTVIKNPREIAKTIIIAKSTKE